MLPAVPLPTVRSSSPKSVTASLKVMVMGKGPSTGSVGPVISTVGAVRSAVTDNWSAASLPLPAASVALFAARSTVTSPPAVGVIIAV